MANNCPSFLITATPEPFLQRLFCEFLTTLARSYLLCALINQLQHFSDGERLIYDISGVKPFQIAPNRLVLCYFPITFDYLVAKYLLE